MDASQDTVTIQPLEIDYSTDVKPHAAPDENWEAPPHRFFGKKDPITGKLEKEPIYTFVPYPSMRYAQPDGPGTKIVTKMVRSEDEDKAIGPGWHKTAAIFGYIGAPSHEENMRLQQSPAQRLIDEQAAKDAYERSEAAKVAQKAAEEESERKLAAQRAADEAALQDRINAAVAAALAAHDLEKRGPGRPRGT